jgi:hypothetical protein
VRLNLLCLRGCIHKAAFARRRKDGSCPTQWPHANLSTSDHVCRRLRKRRFFVTNPRGSPKLALDKRYGLISTVERFIPSRILDGKRCTNTHLLTGRSRMKDLTHRLSEPHVQRIAFEARMPDHGVPYRRYLFRRFQTDQIMKLCHRPSDASRHR